MNDKIYDQTIEAAMEVCMLHESLIIALADITDEFEDNIDITSDSSTLRFTPANNMSQDDFFDSLDEEDLNLFSIAQLKLNITTKAFKRHAERLSKKGHECLSLFIRYIVFNETEFRMPFIEPYVLKDKLTAIGYAVTREMDRWDELERILYNDAEMSVDYAYNVLEERWHEAEPYIIKNPMEASRYACIFMKETGWPSAEECILTNPEAAGNYASIIKNNDWLEAEQKFKDNKNMYKIYKNHAESYHVDFYEEYNDMEDEEEIFALASNKSTTLSDAISNTIH
jgi:hypothetical protein